MVLLCQHIVEDKEVKGTIDGWASVIADRGVNVGKGAIDIRRGRGYNCGEVSGKGHSFVSIRGFQLGYL